MSGKLFIISAPSGAGKTSLVEKLLESMKCHCQIDRVITYTSKCARCTEKDGCDYHFVSEDEFRKKIDCGFFMEWSDAYGCFYGSPCSILDQLKCGKSYILIIDRVGAEKITKKCPDAVLIWIYTKGIDVLRQRLECRNTERPEQIESRLNRAQAEIDLECRCPLFRYHLLNDDFDLALRELERIIKKELGADKGMLQDDTW